MKFWTIYAAMISASLIAQDATTNTPAEAPSTTDAPPAAIETPAPAPAIETPAPAPAMSAPEGTTSAAPAATTEMAPPAAATEAKPAEAAKTEPVKKKVVRKKPAPELKTIPLVPGPAVVSATRVNVRGKAGLHGEIVTRMTNSEPVTVIEEIRLKHSTPEEPSVWAKIVLPEKVHVWVFSKYVDTANKTVTARKLNMRAGSGENYSILGVLKRGDAVKVVETKGNWLEIEAPADCYAYVAAQYLSQESSKLAAVAAATPEEQTSEMPQGTQGTVVIGGTTEPMTNTVDLTSTTPPEEMGAETNTTPAELLPEEMPPRIVAHEGVVRGATSIQAPTSYELINPDTRKIVNYLHTTSTNLDLSRYKGLLIVVTGEEGLDERWKNTPIIEIQRIQVIE